MCSNAVEHIHGQKWSIFVKSWQADGYQDYVNSQFGDHGFTIKDDDSDLS